MMRAVKNSIRVIAAGLLMLVMAVLLPRELYHHHDHHHHAGHTDHPAGPADVQAADDCPICDFQLLPFTFSLESPQIFTPAYFKEKTFAGPSAPVTELIPGFSGRAPPYAFS